jgi:hypothetical protein
VNSGCLFPLLRPHQRHPARPVRPPRETTFRHDRALRPRRSWRANSPRLSRLLNRPDRQTGETSKRSRP